MSDQQSKPTCISCLYDLTGLPTHNNRVRCPECDSNATPVFINNPFQPREMHARFASQLLLPTTLPQALFLLGAYFIPGLYIGTIPFIAFMLAGTFSLKYICTKSIREDAESIPTSIRMNTIGFWSFTYCIPSLVLLIILFEIN